ncbi:MAG: CoA transferase [Hyphomicrobiales bacterium]|nr:CoA transferase [Hyphomicrobiales bacterium]
MMLEGIRVLDLGSFITAPLAAQMLGDLGADVIKVERPEGDPFRRSDGSTYSPTFLAYNRNKRSITIDTTTQAGQQAQRRLIETADVLIDNYRTPVLKKLGLDPDELRTLNPRLIHCSITGFGSKGPYQARAAFDTVGQALSGLAGMMVDPDKPEAFGPTISDNVTGMYAAYGVMGALVERHRTGVGRRIEVNMLESSMAFMPDIFTNYTRDNHAGGRRSRVMRSQSYVFACKDGRMLAFHLSTGEKFWGELIKAIGMPELNDDERFSRHVSRVRNYPALEELLRKRFVERTRAQWVEQLSKFDVTYAPVNSIAEAVADPQVAALGTMAKAVHPREGDVVSIETPLFIDGGRARPENAAPPMLGEHTDEICAELGIDPVSIKTKLPGS